jgi:hypothetical protein
MSKKPIEKRQFWGFVDNITDSFYVHLPPYDNNFAPSVQTHKEIVVDEKLSLTIDYHAGKIVGVEFIQNL